MALGPIHCGSFLLLAATVLLVVASISSPVVKQISFLNINEGSTESTFGVFGYCQNIHANSAGCSQRKLGYDIAQVASSVAGYSYSNTKLETVTKALILHPIAAGIAFLSFLIALCSDHLGFIFASLIAFVAFLVSLAAMAIDFAIFTIIRHEINDHTSASASYGNAIWMVLAATVVLFFASFIVCFECFGSRRRRRDETGYAGNGYVGNQPGYATGTTAGYKKRHFWQRGSRY